MKWLLLAIPLVMAACEKHDHDHEHGSGKHSHEAPKVASDKAKDPVCGMTIAKGDCKAEFDKADYYFCVDVCREKFQAEPTKYVKACGCAASMKSCDCSHCAGKREPCDCGG
jgi:YHS domain-containing protein